MNNDLDKAWKKAVVDLILFTITVNAWMDWESFLRPRVGYLSSESNVDFGIFRTRCTVLSYRSLLPIFFINVIFVPVCYPSLFPDYCVRMSSRLKIGLESRKKNKRITKRGKVIKLHITFMNTLQKAQTFN